MKKFTLFSLVLCFGAMYAVPSLATCGASTISFKGNQDPDDDEFLYETQKQFNLTKQGYKNSDHQNSGEGKGIECDTGLFGLNISGCEKDSIVTLGPGHIFKGKTVNAKREYQCQRGFGGTWDDVWVEVGGKCKTQWGDLDVGRAIKNRTTIDCSGLDKTENNVDTVKVWQVICREGGLVICKPTECVKGYKLDEKNGKCIPDCKDCDDKPKTKTCEQLYPNDAEAIACCKQEGKDRWDGKNRVCKCKDTSKEWSPDKKQCVKKGGGGKIINPPVVNPNNDPCKQFKSSPERYACCLLEKAVPQTARWVGTTKSGHCECLDGKKWDSELKQCVAKQQEDDGLECVYSFHGTINCRNGQSYTEDFILRLSKSDLEGKSCDEYKKMLDDDKTRLEKYFDKLCATKNVVNPVNPGPTDNGPTEAEISEAESVLARFASNAKSDASVWKNAEGKFNSARLASDLTAGVVLGTVGGVVSGVVIKKNQVKKGFEALHCTVGGQKIADWGDEFSVGLNR